ncbi:MAG: LrgB family protein [Bacillota bacterium]|nr:LrgB family protein [Bacillota bacterium]
MPNDFLSDMMSHMTGGPYFAIFLSLLFFYIGVLLSNRFKTPLLSPLLVCVVLTITTLRLLGISYEEYMKGGQYIHFFLTPVTVLLVVPLYKQLPLLRKNFWVIISGVTVGAIVAITSIVVLGRLFGISKEVLISIMPKSVTAGIGMPLAEEFGGLASIAAFSIVYTGIAGAIIGDFLLTKLKLDDPVTYGVSMGVSAHAMGTSKSMEKGEEYGSLAGLCIALCGIITVILFPLYMNLLP